jgi:hypothetical protein
MTDCKNTLLYDLEYVRTCVEKAIEAVPEDFTAETFLENTYYSIEREGDTVSGIKPACLVGQILVHIGVDDSLMSEIAHQYNSMGLVELADRVHLPIDDAAVIFLCEVQSLNDNHVPWHRILEQLPKS